MALPWVFANLTAGSQPAAKLDDNFNALGVISTIPCTAAGSNSITLTPVAGTPTITTYNQMQAYRFIATASSTSTVVIQVNAVGLLSAYKASASGPVAAGNGDLIIGECYDAVYDAALNAAAGGFHIYNVIVSASATSAVQQNVIINGGMVVNQRVVTTAAADDTYALDRWNLLTQTSTVTIAQQTAQEDGTPFNIRITQAQASAQRVGLEQIVENVNCSYLRGQTVAMDARVRISASQPIRYAILEWTGTADTVTSDVVLSWTSASYTAGGFFLASNITVAAVGSMTPSAATWTTLTTLTATLSSSLNNLIVFIWTEGTAAQNVTLDISKVQCLVGSTTPTFDPTPQPKVLQQCQRYYFKTFAQATKPAQSAGSVGALSFPQPAAASTATSSSSVSFPTQMRIGPSVTLFNIAAANAQVRNTVTATDCASSTADAETWRVFVSFTTPAATAVGQQLMIQLTASAEL